jgi:tRNA (cytidine32/guanosine34-2'-O)-methyltransferase
MCTYFVPANGTEIERYTYSPISSFPFIGCDTHRVAEAFVVCRGYKPPPDFRPAALRHVLNSADAAHAASQDTPEMRRLVPFQACGDLEGWDADASYSLPEGGYRSLPPVQPPTAPPYQEALDRIRGLKAGVKSN